MNRPAYFWIKGIRTDNDFWRLLEQNMLDIDKNLRKLEKMKKSKPLKKFKGDGGEASTRLEPYKREKIDVRDVNDLIEPDEE